MDCKNKAAREKKVGIITLVGSFNYGNRLQNYAMSLIWKRMGFTPVTLRFTGCDFFHLARHKLGQLLKPWRRYDAELSMSKDRKKAFCAFDDNIEMEDVEQIGDNLAERFSFFSVGSDQIWNPSYINNYRWVFAEFASESQRVALCPSIGVREIPVESRRRFKKGLDGFRALSVREESGERIISNLVGEKASVLIDPTLMVGITEWCHISDSRLTPSVPYLFAYILGDKDTEIDDFLCEICGRENLELIRISDNDDGLEIPAGPAEFVSLIENASFVVTNSYHAVIFASIFNRPFILIDRKGGQDMSDRFDTLFSKFDYDFFCLGIENAPGQCLIAGESFNRQLASERAIFMDYLLASIGDDLKVGEEK